MLVNGRTFVIADSDGSLRAPRHGLVFEDVRILSTLAWQIEGPAGFLTAQMLSTSQGTPFSSVTVSALRGDGESLIVSDEIVIHRQWIGRGSLHRFEYRNLSDSSVRRTFSLLLEADFAHIFDMKAQKPAGDVGSVTVTEDGLRIDGGRPTTTQLKFDPQPSRVTDGTAHWTIDLDAGAMWAVDLHVEPVVDDEPVGMAFRDGPPMIVTRRLPTTMAVETTDARVQGGFDQALTDLAALRIYDPSNPGNVVVAAGAPWFMTLFGRDSLLTSMMALPWTPDLAVGVVTALADLQGTTTDLVTEEAPGKIIHELRRSSGTKAFGERGRYFGSVDSTPLFVMLIGQLHRAALLSPSDFNKLVPHIDAALGWILDAIQSGPDGFVAYERTSDAGLVNQGWKDSWDGVSSQAGALPTGPVALAEVQGYAYAALNAAATMLQSQDVGGRLSSDLAAAASSLKARFNEVFWSAELGHYITGFSEAGPLDSLTTNPGHAIWCGIADGEKADTHLERSMAPDLFTGWGLRTLSSTAALYNPLSYHNGSVWPHDTALVAAGAHRIGRFDIVDRLAEAALDAAAMFGGRPPELFAGFSRQDIGAPIPYPSSCSPQAWSSASTLQHLRNSLDLAPDGTIRRRNGSLRVAAIDTMV